MEIVLLLLTLFNGGVLDPNGGRHARAETGSCVDPNGRVIPCNAGASIVHGETGTCIDPNGHPIPCSGQPGAARVNRGLTSDSGGGMDPNGATAPRGQWPWQG